MKKIILTIALILSLGVNLAWAESNNANSSVRTIKSPRFARPLIEKWIAEYAKTEPGVTFQLVKGSANQDDIDLNVTLSYQQENKLDLNPSIVYFGETAILPITGRSSEAARLLEGKHLNSKKLKQLFFLDDDLEEETGKKNKAFESITIYSGSNASSVASLFASNFGEEQSNFRGKRISGDDLFLNTALAKDPSGVSFNTLSNIFNLQSRHLKDDLSIVGLDLKKDAAQAINDNGTLDEVLTTLENVKPTEVTVDKVGITFDNADDAVNRFVEWVLEHGTKYNHEYGLLKLDNKEISQQIEKIQTRLTAQK